MYSSTYVNQTRRIYTTRAYVLLCVYNLPNLWVPVLSRQTPQQGRSPIRLVRWRFSVPLSV